jgi:type I restriction enzyme, S subunit
MVINQKCIRNYKLNLDLARYTDPEKKKIADEKYLKSFDVLVNSTGVGTLGRVAQISEVNGPVTSDSHVTIVRPDCQTIDPLYFGYCLKSRQKDIESLGEGSTGQTELSRVLLGDMEIEILEDFKEQRAVGNFLKAIDKKIELNQKMNETLEEIAKTLFKSWFIDFDPVRAKAEGKPTGLSKEISDLFPDSFEDSELGEIPRGWRADCLQNIVECFDSKRIPLSKKSRQERVGIYPYYGATSIIDYVDDYLFDDELVFIGEDGSVERDDGTPFIQFINEKCWVNNHAHVLKAKDQFSNFYIYIFLNQVKIGPYVTGAVQKKINQTNLFSIPVIIPDEKILKAFNSITDPLKDKIFLNSKESDVLSSIRDTLLPKLISGELKISDAENFIHGAGV